MKQKLLTSIFCLMPLLVFSQSNTPAAINASGGTGMVATTTLDWSVAEMTLVSTASGAGISITQGVLQPADLPLSVKDLQDPGDKIKVYPNPMGDLVFVESSFDNKGVMTCQVYDGIGKQIMEMSFPAESGKVTRSISTGKLAPGTYLLQTIYKDANGLSGTVFTIQKQ